MTGACKMLKTNTTNLEFYTKKNTLSKGKKINGQVEMRQLISHRHELKKF